MREIKDGANKVEAALREVGELFSKGARLHIQQKSNTIPPEELIAETLALAQSIEDASHKMENLVRSEELAEHELEALRQTFQQIDNIMGWDDPSSRSAVYINESEFSEQERETRINEVNKILWLSINSVRNRHEAIPSSPTWGRFILRLALPREDYETVVGDLLEGYHLDAEEFGHQRAVWIYRWQVIGFIRPVISQRVGKVISGALGFLAGKII